jgi:dTDP-4-dehydrorhamnose 3,5-epimerase
VNLIPTGLAEVFVVETPVFRDARGFFFESWREERYRAAGIIAPFVQDNVSVSAQGVVRGLHYQNPEPQGKLITVLSGAAYDVVVDLRMDSPRFGRWTAVRLKAGEGRQVWVPEGFAHGFQALEDDTILMYKCTRAYAPQHDRSLRWDDPALGIDWPLRDAVLSQKDAAAPPLSAIDPIVVHS